MLISLFWKPQQIIPIFAQFSNIWRCINLAADKNRFPPFRLLLVAKVITRNRYELAPGYQNLPSPWLNQTR
jgi:hypothetical protein